MSWTTPTSVESTESRPGPEGTRALRRWVPSRPDALSLATLPGRRLGAVVTVRDWTVIVSDPVAVVRDPGDLDDLGRRCGWRDEPLEGFPPFVGGAVGYLTDECAAAWLHLPPDRRPHRGGIESMHFGVYDHAVCIPPDGDGSWLVATDFPGWSRDPIEARLDRLQGDLTALAPIARPPSPLKSPPPQLSLDVAAHHAAVARIREWIAAGDLYQLNLTLQMSVPWGRGGVELARRLWAASPSAAHAAWLDVGQAHIVSISPETFLRTDADAVSVRPIKGTRPRSPDPATDTAAGQALRASDKDRAEHVMIVDLERNDLGQVCETGSVHVTELMVLERFPTVWHLTSTVVGALSDSVELTDMLRATFPCGSVTGAPKRMAVARIRAVEPVRRGVYCGAVGVISRGIVDLSVAIRTAVLEDGVARYGTGGGIVADSDPEAEFEEAMDKAEAFLTAVGADRPRAKSPRQ